MTEKTNKSEGSDSNVSDDDKPLSPREMRSMYNTVNRLGEDMENVKRKIEALEDKSDTNKIRLDAIAANASIHSPYFDFIQSFDAGYEHGRGVSVDLNSKEHRRLYTW